MSDSDVVIRVEGLGKKYSLHHEQGERYTALRDVVARQAKAAGRLLNPFTLAGQLRKAQRQAAQRTAAVPGNGTSNCRDVISVLTTVRCIPLIFHWHCFSHCSTHNLA